jgi:predicted  nucleic acid-binding Zn-ribbon protein
MSTESEIFFNPAATLDKIKVHNSQIEDLQETQAAQKQAIEHLQKQIQGTLGTLAQANKNEISELKAMMVELLHFPKEIEKLQVQILEIEKTHANSNEVETIMGDLVHFHQDVDKLQGRILMVEDKCKNERANVQNVRQEFDRRLKEQKREIFAEQLGMMNEIHSTVDALRYMIKKSIENLERLSEI